MALKTLQEINHNFMLAKPNQKIKTKRIYFIITDVIFYLAVFLIFISVLTFDIENNRYKSLFGYSCFTVISGSMEDEIPKGSLILVRETEPRNLNINDNITFIRDNHTPVTHKIINIYENYDGTGALGFQTKGTNNANPDRDIVNEADVIGKAALVLPKTGQAITFIGENSYVVLIISGLWIIICLGLRIVIAKGGE